MAHQIQDRAPVLRVGPSTELAEVFLWLYHHRDGVVVWDDSLGAGKAEDEDEGEGGPADI